MELIADRPAVLASFAWFQDGSTHFCMLASMCNLDRWVMFAQPPINFFRTDKRARHVGQAAMRRLRRNFVARQHRFSSGAICV
jgi:hypothetical protein